MQIRKLNLNNKKDFTSNKIAIEAIFIKIDVIADKLNEVIDDLREKPSYFDLDKGYH